MTTRANPEAALVRRVRLRLLAWSGGTTLAVLLLLGTVIYLAVANSLASAGADQLRARASFVSAGLLVPFGCRAVRSRPAARSRRSRAAAPRRQRLTRRTRRDRRERARARRRRADVGHGGLRRRTDRPDRPGRQPGDPDLRDDPAGHGRASRPCAPGPPPVGSEVLASTDVGGNPIRILTTSVERPDGVFVVQVVGDRSDEVRTLTVLLTVLDRRRAAGPRRLASASAGSTPTARSSRSATRSAVSATSRPTRATSCGRRWRSSAARSRSCAASRIATRRPGRPRSTASTTR